MPLPAENAAPHRTLDAVPVFRLVDVRQRWDNRYTSPMFREFIWSLFDILHDGHRPNLRMRFAPVYGERQDLLDVLHRHALDKSRLDTGWQWIVFRSATELARFAAYRNTSNYVRVQEAIGSIRTAFEADRALRPVWLRVVAWLYYTCGVRTAIHGSESAIITRSCGMNSGLVAIGRQCVISLFFFFARSQ